MRASFSSWCDEYYNLKMLLIGELFRSKAILERRQDAVKKKLYTCIVLKEGNFYIHTNRKPSRIQFIIDTPALVYFREDKGRQDQYWEGNQFKSDGYKCNLPGQ